MPRNTTKTAAPTAAEGDRALVDRCLAGDKLAWQTLYDKFHSPLLLAIRILLGRSSVRHDIVDEIAAKVWFAVVDHKGHLLGRFDSERGCRLSTFLAGLARNEISRYFRAERRRNVRETQVCRNRELSVNDSHCNTIAGLSTAVADFLATLTRRERAYCEGYLLGSDEPLSTEFSDANRWQLNHRVRLKLFAFVNES